MVPDYRLFQIEPRNSKIIAATVIEVKTNDGDRVCQTIGYHVASRASVHTDTEGDEDSDDPFPSLAILICEAKARLIFFPFINSRKASCLEAVVLLPITIISDSGIDPKFITFVCTYIDRLYHATPVLMTEGDILFKLHDRKTFHQYIYLSKEENAIKTL